MHQGTIRPSRLGLYRRHPQQGRIQKQTRQKNHSPNGPKRTRSNAVSRNKTTHETLESTGETALRITATNPIWFAPASYHVNLPANRSRAHKSLPRQRGCSTSGNQPVHPVYGELGEIQQTKGGDDHDHCCNFSTRIHVPKTCPRVR